MKVFAIISLILAAVVLVLFGYATVDAWFNRERMDFKVGVLVDVFVLIWLFTAIGLCIAV